MPKSISFQYSVVNYIYLSAIEKLICYTEIEADKVYFLRFCTKCLSSKYGIELIVALS